MPPVRILFVDDEEAIRITLSAVLSKHGYQVDVAATVGEALSRITNDRFDVLIADLNVGQPGDGFTVVSAMRRTQPDCVTFILTGYPAFETALEAIRSQVDDYSRINLKTGSRVKHCRPSGSLACCAITFRKSRAKS